MTAKKDKPRITAREAVTTVLADGKPMKAAAISEAAAPIATGLKGKTPEASIGALLAVEAKKADGLVIRTAPGTFKLRPVSKGPDGKTSETA